MQAVIGYDELRQTLWIRDPFVYYATEFCIEPLRERYRATGPRGMAMIPRERPDMLEGITLPDSELYEQLYAVQSALANHRRADAVAHREAMHVSAPNHRLTLTAHRAIAAYDSNTPAMLQCVNELLQQFPDDGNLQLAKLSCLRDLARRDERLEALKEICARPTADPIFWLQYGQELAADARQHCEASTSVRRAMRMRSTDPDVIAAWANLLWERRDFERASPT